MQSFKYISFPSVLPTFMSPSSDNNTMQKLVPPAHTLDVWELEVRPTLPVSRVDQLMFSSSNDNTMPKQAPATHTPDGLEFKVRPVLHVVESIFRGAKPKVPGVTPEGQPHLEISDGRAIRNVLGFLAYTINKVAYEMFCKCMGGEDAHATAMNVFNILSTYNWDAKAVLALAALVVGYGEFWLVIQLYPTNALAKGIAALKQIPEILEQADTLKPMFEALTSLVSAMLELTKCIIEFSELPSQYISAEAPELSTAIKHMPTATYLIIRSVVACASRIVGLIGMGPEYMDSTVEARELLSLEDNIVIMQRQLTKQLVLCHQIINENKIAEAFEKLVQLFKKANIDNRGRVARILPEWLYNPNKKEGLNIEILQALINAKDDQLPLIDGSTKRRVGLEVLRRKIVLLLISEIDIRAEELAILEQKYVMSRQDPTGPDSQYEIVFIPVLDQSVPGTDEMQKQFERTQGIMPWHSVYHPSLIGPAVIKYIKEVWKFNKKAMLVVLDPQGKVDNCNALRMMWIWGSLAYPFTRAREAALWKGETWRIELLVDNIDPLILTWISKRRYICLYGGEDLGWIRKFTNTIRAVADALRIPLEMMYVGKRNPKKKVQEINTAIERENLSHTLPDLTLIWFFWVRLESMWHSKVQTGKSVETDRIMQEIMAMLSYDSSDQGWAVISRGSAEMAKGNVDTMVTTLKDYELWKDKIDQKGFVPALKSRLQDFHTLHHRTHLILPGATGGIPERLVCAECGRTMEKFIMYRCCTE